MDKSELYRTSAAQCLELASSITDANSRVSLLEMAWKWLRLAELAEKDRSTDLVYETPPRRIAT